MFRYKAPKFEKEILVVQLFSVGLMSRLTAVRQLGFVNDAFVEVERIERERETTK